MRTSAKDYRNNAYRLRAHPRDDEFDFFDRRDSFATVYLSVIPFAAAEYFTEVSFDLLPGGLVFPVGFLLFWAFYYTYYKPGFLENRLVSPQKMNVAAIPTLVLGILIWFVKVTLVEVSHLLLFQWITKPKPTPKRAAARPAQAGRTSTGSGPHTVPPTKPPSLLTPDLVLALQVLGLKPGCHWRNIHKQYRALAKQFHPDLNPEITDFGHRFMKVDDAYHRLEKVRSKHFPD
jgi:hypothetical protein